MRYVLPAVLTLMLLDTIAAAQEVSTGFEEFFPNTPLGVPFTIGDSPDSAEFSGDAFAGRIGVFALYRNGVRAWMVASGGTGLIRFESGAAEVEFWARPLPSADGATVITAFDGLDQVINSVELTPGDPFTEVSFAGAIDHIEVVNLATGANDWNGIDDFLFLPAPPPVLGDTNGDFMVNIIDLNAVRNNFGATGPDDGTLPGDAFPFDGFVNIIDLNGVRNNFGAGATVPEPSTFALASLFVFVGIIARRRRG